MKKIEDSVVRPKYVSEAEKSSTILYYFFPELITSLIIYCAINLIDSFFIAYLQMTSSYTTLGVTSTLFHFITKIAEGFSVGMTVLCGQYNGIGDYKQTGKSVVDAFWATCITGSIIALALYIGASYVYAFYEVPDDMIALGVPFLQLSAIGVFFNFICLALIGFLRGIKNTRVPMLLFLIGAIFFVFFDYALIFGKFGFPQLGFQGSALARVIQYIIIFIGALLYIIYNSHMKVYNINFFSAVRWDNVRSLVNLSWPVMFDKATLAFCQIWLAKMIGVIAKAQTLHVGKVMLASYVAIRDLQIIAILPGAAFAQVITFLVSNDYRAHKWSAIMANIKKVLLFSFIMVFSILIFFSIWPQLFLYFFDKENKFSYFAAKVIPILTILVVFDLFQLILSAALRGSANVKIVMWVRTLSCIFFMVPLAYILSHIAINNALIHFILVYSSLYLGNALMGVIYIYYFKTNSWKKRTIEGN